MDHRIFEIGSGTWRIEEYDEHNSVYMYLFRGSTSALLLDTGFGTVDLPGIIRSLTSLPLTVLCTHAHFDHIGGSPAFDRVYIHSADRNVYAEHTSPETLAAFGAPAFRASGDNILWFEEDRTFDLGGRILKTVHTPGHTPGCICLLEEDRRSLYTGDSCCKADVLLNFGHSTSISVYAESIRKILQLKDRYDRTWPAHHSVPVTAEIPQQFEEAAELLLSKKAGGTDFESPFGVFKRFPYKDIAIDYTPDKL